MKNMRQGEIINTVDPTRAIWTPGKGVAIRIKNRIGTGLSFQQAWDGIPESAKQGTTLDEVQAILIKQGIFIR